METLGARAPSLCRCLRIALVAIGAVLLPVSDSGAVEAARLAPPSPRLGCGQDQNIAEANPLLRARLGHRLAEAQEPEGTPMLLRWAFYTCAGRTQAPVPIGAGWLAIGPVRRS